MSAWRALLAGLSVWLLHFAIVYLLPSLDAIGALPPRVLDIAHVAVTLACLAAAAGVALAAWRRAKDGDPGAAFRHRVAALGAALAGVAIVWQAAPALFN